MAMNNSARIEALVSDPGAENPDLEDSTRIFVYLGEAFIQPIILIFGFLTNVVSIIVLRKVRMNEVFRICLVSLSYVDAIACLVGFVQLVVEVSYFDGNIIQGTMDPPAIASNTLYFTYLMFMCSSASMVILIALIRNFFVLRPMRARAFFTPSITKLACFMAFFVTLIIFAPVSLKIISQSCEREVNVSICETMESTTPTLNEVAKIYVHYFLAVLYGPLTIIVYLVCVICIRITIKRSVKTLSIMTPRQNSTGDSNTIKDGPSDEARARSRTAARITKTLLIILIMDVICTLPYVIQGIGLFVARGKSIFNETGDQGMIYDAIVEIFLNLRPSYNFWLYVYQHPEFRIRVKSILHRICYPCYKSKCCPCCQMELEPATPLRSPPAWSMSTPSGTSDKGPWFKRLSSKIQNSKEFLSVPMKSQLYRGSPKQNSHSMDSDSDFNNSGSTF